MTTTDLRSALEGAVAELPVGLRDHVLRVVTEARRLAERYGVDEERTVAAARVAAQYDLRLSANSVLLAA